MNFFQKLSGQPNFFSLWTLCNFYDTFFYHKKEHYANNKHVKSIFVAFPMLRKKATKMTTSARVRKLLLNLLINLKNTTTGILTVLTKLRTTFLKFKRLQ